MLCAAPECDWVPDPQVTNDSLTGETMRLPHSIRIDLCNDRALVWLTVEGNVCGEGGDEIGQDDGRPLYEMRSMTRVHAIIPRESIPQLIRALEAIAPRS